MVDPKDEKTPELPGITKPDGLQPWQRPPKEAKRRDLAGYIEPKAMRTCRKCKHLTVTGTRNDALRCHLHGFKVALQAVCSSFDAT